MSRLAGDWTPALEIATARLVLRVHARRRCFNCTRNGCRVLTWARGIRRRETAVAILLAGCLPVGVTVTEIRTAVDRIR